MANRNTRRANKANARKRTDPKLPQVDSGAARREAGKQPYKAPTNFEQKKPQHPVLSERNSVIRRRFGNDNER